MNNYITSYIRTYVPVLVGSVLAYLATRFGIVVDETTSTQLGIALAGLLTALYYFIARTLERRFPQLGWLLGNKQQPVYVDPETQSTK